MLWYIIEVISSLWNSDSNLAEAEPPDEGWFALLSETEKRISQEQRNAVATELRLIASNWGKLRAFPRISEAVRKIISQYDPDTLQEISSFSLSADIKHRIFKDILTELSPVWLEEIIKFVPEASENWYPEKYCQNILGEMVSLTSHTSPDQLTVLGLSQTIKAIHLSLIQSLNSYRTEPISLEESLKILDLMISTTITKIIDLWIETVEKCKLGLSKEGQTVDKIKQREAEEKEKLLKIKESGMIDARFSTGESDKIRQSYLEGRPEHLLGKQEYDDLKKHLGSIFSN